MSSAGLRSEFTDTGTVAWKEFRELAAGYRSGRGRTTILIYLAVFGVMVPLQTGRAWIETALPIFSWAWLPFLIVSGIMADAIAGERDRHTLETLLATRLSDRAILAGKILAAVLYACAHVWGIALVSLVAVNLAFSGHGFLFFPPAILSGIVLFPLLVAVLSGGITTLVALKADSVRQIQQTMGIASFVFLAPFLALNFLPESVLEAVSLLIDGVGGGTAAAAAALFLTVADLVVLSRAFRRFRRPVLMSSGS